MLRHYPKFTYCGMTIVMSNPARDDRKALIDGTEHYFFEKCLYPEINRYQCDIRLIDDKSPLLKDTKVILLLGARAHALYTGLATSLDENRGSPVIVNGIPCISSFTPRDACDIKDIESSKNPHLLKLEEEDNEDEKLGDLYAAKGRGSTAWSNYRFWLKADVKKCIRILENKGNIPSHGLSPRYHLWPNPNDIIRILTETKGQDLFFDMETDFHTMDMRCFAFSFGNNPEDVYVVPVLDVQYKPAYESLPYIMRSLAIAMRDNCTVAHNGALFDFVVLAWKYGLPIGDKVYDTLVANHRIFPTVEKSLGHCVSYWTYEPYHKNEGVHGYYNAEQAEQLYRYCGKDVFTMYLVKKAQLEYASKDPGLLASIQQGMDAIKPYLTTSLMGIRYDFEKRARWIAENDRLMYQYLRIMRMLTGPNVPDLISNQKCGEYFHHIMGYPVVGRTKKNAPSLAKDNLYKLKLRNPNQAVIDFLIKYRETQTETGKLNFKPLI